MRGERDGGEARGKGEGRSRRGKGAGKARDAGSGRNGEPWGNTKATPRQNVHRMQSIKLRSAACWTFLVAILAVALRSNGVLRFLRGAAPHRAGDQGWPIPTELEFYYIKRIISGAGAAEAEDPGEEAGGSWASTAPHQLNSDSERGGRSLPAVAAAAPSVAT